MAKTKLKFSRGLEKELPTKYSDGEIRFCTDTGALFIDNATGRTKIAAGKADTADKLTTARVITLAGDVTGSVSFDGSKAVTITTTVKDDSHNHIINNIDGLQSILDAKAPIEFSTNYTNKKKWTAVTKVGSYSRLCQVTGHGNFLFSISLAQNSQVSIYTFAIGFGWQSAEIHCIASTGYSANANQILRITRPSDSDSVYYIEILNNFSYDSTATKNCICTINELQSTELINNVVSYTEYTATDETHIEEASCETQHNGIVAPNFYGNATSSTTATTAATATKLSTSAGSTTQPVYFKDGKPVVTTYALNKTVPADAKFTDTTYSAATTSADGLMTADMVTKLNGIATGANKYILPNATSSILGGVKIGSNITVSSGTISLTKENVTAALGYTPPTANTTYSIATASAAGLVKPISVITKPTINSTTTTSGRYYSIQMSSDGNMFVNVPWGYSAATTSAAGLMSAEDKKRLDSVVGLTPLSTPNRTIAELRTALDNWLNTYKNFAHATAIFSGSADWINRWNDEDLTTAFSAGGKWTVTVIASYDKNTYVHLRFAYYEDQNIVYVVKNNNVWQPARKVAFKNKLSDGTVGSSSKPIYLNNGVPTECGTLSLSTTGNAATATKATQDGSGNNIVNTYATKATVNTNLAKSIIGLSVSGQTITYTKGDGSTGTIKTQDTNTTYTFNGAVSTIKDNNLTANRALISNGSGKVAVSDITSTELGYLDGVTFNLQTQLNDKAKITYKEYSNFGTASTETDGWYTLFTLSDSLTGSALCLLRAYAHTSVIFTATKGYADSTTLNVLDYNSTANGSYAHVKALRILADGKVQAYFHTGTVRISIHIVSANGELTPVTSLVCDTTTTDSKVCVSRTLSQGKIIADGFIGNLTGNATTATTATKLGTSTVGSTSLPIYLDAGTPKAISSAIPIIYGGTGATTAAGILTNLGITATAAELNKLDGITATTTELNYIDGVTSNIQTQLNGKLGASATAAAAIKLTTSAGSATQPVYFSGGKPVACTYALNKTVPADAKFTDTTYNIAKADAAGLVKPVSVITKPTINSITTTTGRYYSVQMSSDGNMFVNVPWVNNTYSLSSFGITATATELNYVDGVTSNIQTQLNNKVSNSMGYVNKALSWNSSSYLQNVILLIPVPQSTNWSGFNFIDGRFFCWKSGGNVYDVIEINANCVYNQLKYHLESFGDYAASVALCVCKYNGVSYYAIKCPYHANPYNNVTFVGRIRSDISGGTDTVSLPLQVPYYNEDTGAVLNAEVKNSITDTLTTAYVTSANGVPLHSKNGFVGNLTGNATSAGSATTAINVSAQAGTTNANRHIWFSDSATETKRAYDDDFKYNPSTNVLTVGSITGNASTATKLATARTISLDGNMSGSIDFDGSGNKSFSAKIGKEWTAITTVGAYSRLCLLSGYSNWILSIQLSQSSQVSYHTYLIGIGYECGSISQIGNTGYTTYSNQVIRLGRNNATSAFVEIFNNYGYNSAKTVNCTCKLIPLSESAALNAQTYYTAYTAGANTSTVWAEITSQGKGIVSSTFYGNLSGNATSATNVAWSGVTSKPSYYDAKAIKSITRSGTTFTYTCMDGTTGTFTQQDNNTTYSAAGNSLGLVKSGGDVTISSGVITVVDDSHNHTQLKGNISSSINMDAANGTMRYDYNIVSTATGLFPTTNNANAIITINRHSGAYDSQLGFSANGKLYYRNFNAVNNDTTTAWKQIAFTDSNVASATKATQDGSGNTITSTYLKLSGGTLSGKLTASGKISVPTSGSAWISGMTTGNASIAISTQNTSGSYHPIIAGKTYNGHIWNLGTYVDSIGFYGFKSGRTENATDWGFTINVSSGAINASGSITAASFHGSGSGLTSLNASNISSGTLAVARGGTGITSNPSMLINLGSTSAANVFATSPRPGITGTLGLANGGTGKTTAKDAANAFINALDTGSSAPVDADYYICQYAGGGTSTTTYHRRPTSALWTYMKGKIDTTYYKTVTKSGAIGSVTLADKTDYIYTGVTSLTLVYPSGNFECWLSVTTSTSAITLSFPSGTKFIGASITSLAANTTYEISIKNKVAIIKKVG